MATTAGRERPSTTVDWLSTPPHIREKGNPDMASEIDMSRLNITRQNVAVEKVLASTINPRHRYLL